MQDRKIGKRFLADESGATAIEYAILCGIMMAVAITVASAGGSLDGLYARLSDIADAMI